MTRPISDLDVPLAVVEAQTAAVATLHDAAAHTHSPSDRLAYALDEWFVTHDVPLSTEADYPNWRPGGAA
ncbi:hypothetical protein ABZ876_08095 [Streptomyces sp. NPDC046931]|uniref:hypothetical protein n=1 Tax=Streptomyces sp. NPDC046931 TaxID=3154806 RepID=UPI0033C334B0